MINDADQLKAYSEACNTLRHYSNASLTIRLASVVQGIAILVAWVVALTQKAALLMIALPIAGLLFTILLHRFHLGYFRATAIFYELAAKMEEKFFSEDCRPMASYHKKHEEVYGNIWGRILTLNAPFLLIAILFVFALLTSCWRLNR